MPPRPPRLPRLLACLALLALAPSRAEAHAGGLGPLDCAAVLDQVAAGPPAGSTGRTRLEQLDDLAGEIQGQLETLRGRRFKEAVRVERLEGSELERRARQRFQRMFSPREVGVLEAVARLLGMLGEGEELRRWFEGLPAGTPKGFYDVTDDVFYVSDDLEPEAARFVLASELARAIEDQYHRLEQRSAAQEGSHDAWLAHQAVVQGALSTLLTLWLDRHVPEFGLVSLARMYEAQSEILGEAPPIVWRPVFALRLRGESFLRRTHMVELRPSDVRMEDIDRAFQEPPRSTEQILHPVKYWRSQRRDDPRLLRLVPLDLPAPWRLVEENTLGELYLGILTLGGEERRPFADSTIVDLLSERYTTDASDGWGGDRYALLQREDGGQLLRLATVWDTVSDAREFYEAVQALREVVVGAKRAWFGLGLDLAGYEVQYEGPDRVTVTSWVGVSREDVEAVLPRLQFEEVEGE